MAASWRKRHVEANGLRTAYSIGRLLDNHVLPAWREREFTGIRRSDITALLDKVEDGHGARQADVVLTIIRSLCNWYAARHDDYAVPVVRAMKRQSAHRAGARRVLDDDELRALWQVSETNGTVRRDGAAGAADRAAARQDRRRCDGPTFPTQASGHIPKSRARNMRVACWCCQKWRSTSSARSRAWATTRMCLRPAEALARSVGSRNSSCALDAKLPKGTAVMDASRSAPHRALADEPGRRIERTRRARHGPRHCWRRGHL